MTTKIEWCDHTFNPWIGCAKVAPGCTFCYAEHDTYPRVSRSRGVELWGPHASRHVTSAAYWRKPLRWAKAARAALYDWQNADVAGERPGPMPHRPRVFCASLADVFEDRADLVEPRARLFDLIYDTPELDWLILTKRPENVARLSDAAWDEGDGPTSLPPNVWLGVSVANQDDADRNVPLLLKIPATVRFLSVEPLIGPVDLRLDDCYSPDDCYEAGARLHWVIVGGESGPKARPCDVAWVRSVVRQCTDASTPVFVKQLGVRAFDGVESGPDGEPNEPYWLDMDNRKGGDPSEWPDDLRVREFPR